jgi:hypothetical protein
VIRYPDNIADFVPGKTTGEREVKPLDLSPRELADILDAVPAYTAADLGAAGFYRRKDDRRAQEVILVSLETRDAVINALRDWKFKKNAFDDYTLKHEDHDGDQLRVTIFKDGMLVQVTDYYQLAVELTPKQAHKLAIGILETLEKVK